MKPELCGLIDELVHEAPRSWMETVCKELRSWPAGAAMGSHLHRLPATYNGDLSYKLHQVLRAAVDRFPGKLWDARSLPARLFKQNGSCKTRLSCCGLDHL